MDAGELVLARALRDVSVIYSTFISVIVRASVATSGGDGWHAVILKFWRQDSFDDGASTCVGERATRELAMLRVMRGFRGIVKLAAFDGINGCGHDAYTKLHDAWFAFEGRDCVVFPCAAPATMAASSAAFTAS